MFKEINSNDIHENTFNLIGKDWMLISAKKPDGKINAMTASWGGMGVMWGKDVVFAVIRPQRYTKEFLDSTDMFTLCFFDNSYKKMLGYMGSVSGRDEDKMSKSGLTVKETDGAPYYEECKMALVCKKLFVQPWNEDCFIDKDIIGKWYSEKDFHFLYIGEIERTLIKK